MWLVNLIRQYRELIKAILGISGGGAPTDAEYIVASSNVNLSAERVVASSTSITANTATPGAISYERAALTGDVTASANSNVTTIGNNVVTDAKAADMPSNTIKANVTGVTGDPSNLAIATSRIIGRGPTGNLVGLIVGSGLTITDTTISATAGSGEANTASNVGAVGVGLFKQKTGVDLEFRNINPASGGRISVALNDANNTVAIDVVANNLVIGSRSTPEVGIFPMKYLSNTTDSDPGTGGFKFNSGILGSITKIWLDSIDNRGSQATHTGYDIPNFVVGDRIVVTDSTFTTVYTVFTCSSLFMDKGGYYEFTGTASAGTLPADLTACMLVHISTSFKQSIQSTITLPDLSGSIDLSGSQASGVLAAGRFPALTGAITTTAGSLATVLATNAVATANIQANAVGNSEFAQMATATIKGNSTGSTGNAQDLTLLGGLTMVSGAPGSLKSKSSFAFPCTFSTTITMSDPGTDGVRFNNAVLASVTQVAISASLGGRDLAALFDTLGSAQIGFMSNNVSSLAHAVFNVTAVNDNGTGAFYTFTCTPALNVGVLPINNEELQLIYWPAVGAGLTTQDVLDMLVIRRNAQNQLIDELGNVISGSPSVANYAALIALDPAAYDGFAVNVQSGLNNSFWVSNGTAWAPLNNQYVQDRSVAPGDKIIFPDNVTWTASDNGSGKVRLTASAAHAMTEANAEGSFLYLISGGTGWVAGTKHRITPTTGFISTTVVDVDTNFTVGMGVPVFAKAGATEALSEAPLLDITLPVLRASTEVELVFNIEMNSDASTNARRPKCYLGSIELNNINVTATNTAIIPLRFGFVNQNATNSQRGLCGSNNTGYSNSTLPPATAAIETNTGTAVLSVRFMPNVPGMVAWIGAHKLFIRG